MLAERGVLFAGLDVVGDKVLRINSWALGGVPDASRFQGVDFLDPIVDAFESAEPRA